MELYVITIFLFLISSTTAAPTIETESKNPPANPKQKISRQLYGDNAATFLIVSPVDTSQFAVQEDELSSMEDNLQPAESVDTEVIVNKPMVEDGEMMHTAENLVFRPLFSYRKLQEKRKRLYGNNKPPSPSSNGNPNTIRRTSYSVSPQRFAYYPYAYNSRPYYTSGGYYYPY